MNAETDIAVLRAILTEMDRRYAERFDAQEKAILKAEGASEKRFDSVNEFRKTLTDQAASFATRDQIDGLKADIKRIENHNATYSGRGLGMSQLWSLIMGAAAFVLAASVAVRGIWPRS